ncbi:3208_t:CDS:2 [Paraglomus occultum]|uniref:3208_t:CDS:1 n=1 Tax=Paraglomus occultum TaxID=144539 RepID=A0A9N9FXG7_9GLOM|nr:3208_t:CDS:2 [Paraglomus occultum]
MDRYCGLIMFDTPLLTAHDTLSDNLVGTDPTDASSERKRSRRQLSKTRTFHIPRPPNAFILYRKLKHKEIKANYRHLTNIQISKVVAMLWWKESEAVRLEWAKMAEQEKLRHMQEHPGYVFKPRKKSDIRKINNRNKKRRQARATVIRTTNDGSTRIEKNNLTTDPELVAIAETIFAASHNPPSDKQHNQHVNNETHSMSFNPDVLSFPPTINNSLQTPPIVPSCPPALCLPSTPISTTFSSYTCTPMSPLFIFSTYSPLPMTVYQSSLQQEPLPTVLPADVF